MRPRNPELVIGALDMGDTLDFLRLLWELEHGLRSRSKLMRNRIGITGPQRLVLRVLGRHPDITATELASALHLHPSTLTGILQRLHEGGLILRSSARGDARRAVLRLSAKGKELDEVTAGTIEATVRSVLSRLPDTKIAAAREVLSAIAAALAPD